MINPLKGAVEFTADGATHSMSFSAGAIYRLEKETGKKSRQIAAIMLDPDAFDMALLRVMFWAGLLDANPALPLDDVDKFLHQLSPIEAVKVVTRAFIGAVVDPDAPAARMEQPADPPKPNQDGTGSAS